MKEFNQFRKNCQHEDIKRDELRVSKIEFDQKLIEKGIAFILF